MLIYQDNPFDPVDDTLTDFPYFKDAPTFDPDLELNYPIIEQLYGD